MADLDVAECFASVWHAGPWCLDRLPSDLGLVTVMVPGGKSVLGLSLFRTRSIALAARLKGHPLERIVMLHECAHHILGLKSEIALCQAEWSPEPAKAEAIAWATAGRLSVSAHQIQELERGCQMVGQVAEDNGVPAALVELGAAVYATNRGDQSRLAPALAAWCSEMQRLVTSL